MELSNYKTAENLYKFFVLKFNNFLIFFAFNKTFGVKETQ